MKKIIEICCGSLEDAITAQAGGADRIELNSALYLGGLTPSIATVKLVLQKCYLPVIAMVRPRAGGFNYNEYEIETILADIEELVKLDIQGVAFGCLTENAEIDIETNARIINLLHKHNKEAVFHRAFDCTPYPYKAAEQLINIKADRILTSGQKEKAIDGIDLLKNLQQNYGKQIEFVVGSGVNAENHSTIMEHTNIEQYHSSCKSWRKDLTTISKVSYAYAQAPYQSCYDIVDLSKVKNFK